MSRYIDADELIKRLPTAEADMFENCRNCTTLDKEQIVGIIYEALTADVIEVVRCNDCK